jgi:integrase
VFNDSELREIFSADWFVSGAGKEVGKGWIKWRPYHFWLPLLGLVTGARLNELSQLDLNDICQTKNGNWYFDFNLDQPDKLEVQDKSLKTSNSVRAVPVHTRLIELGLLEYVAKLRELGHRKLFPELTRDRLKGYSKQSGKWFNSQYLGRQLGFARNGMKTFHSFRHGMLTLLDRNGVDKRTIMQLAGHERGDSITMDRYVKDKTADETQSIINGIEFPCLAQVARFDVTFALKALKCSTRHKSAVARGKQLKAADQLHK